MSEPFVPPTLADAEKLEKPPDFDALFGFKGNLELEIGSGKGGFAVGYASRHPERRLIATEWRVKYANLTLEAAVALKLKNLLVLRTDAKVSVPRLFVADQLDVIHLHFPDPWWKRRHFKRRVVELGYAKQLLGLLKRGGLLDVRTDVADRAHDMQKILLAAGFVNPVGGDGFAPYDPEEVPSTREVRYLQHGEPVWRLRLTRG